MTSPRLAATQKTAQRKATGFPRPPLPLMPIQATTLTSCHLAWSPAMVFLERSAFIRAASPRQAHRQ